MATKRQQKARQNRRRAHGRATIPLAQHLLDIVEGRKPLPAAGAKYQHYLPQMHLRGFSPNLDAGKNARVYQRDHEREAVDFERVDRTGGGHHFNRIAHEDESKRDGLEVWLSLIESYAAESLARLLNDQTNPTRVDRFNLGMYIAFLGARTPWALQNSQTLNTMALDLHWGTMTQDPSWFRSMFRDADVGATDEELEAARQRLQQPGSIDYDDPRSKAFESSFRAAGEVASLVVPMHWTLLRSEHPLIVGDHPVSHFDTEPPRFPWTEPMWATSPTTQSVIPLTSNAALELSLGAWTFDVRDIDADEAMSMNLRTWGWSSRFVFARSEADIEHIRQEVERRPEDVPRASRMHQVVLAPAEGFLPTESNDKPEGWPPFVMVPDNDGRPAKCRYWPVRIDRPEEMRQAAAWAGKAVKRLQQRQERERALRASALAGGAPNDP